MWRQWSPGQNTRPSEPPPCTLNPTTVRATCPHHSLHTPVTAFVANALAHRPQNTTPHLRAASTAVSPAPRPQSPNEPPHPTASATSGRPHSHPYRPSPTPFEPLITPSHRQSPRPRNQPSPTMARAARVTSTVIPRSAMLPSVDLTCRGSRPNLSLRPGSEPDADQADGPQDKPLEMTSHLGRGASTRFDMGCPLAPEARRIIG